MAEGGRVGELPQNIVGDQRLPLRVVIDERLDMLLQKIGGNRHQNLLVHLRVTVRLRPASAQGPSSELEATDRHAAVDHEHLTKDVAGSAEYSQTAAAATSLGWPTSGQSRSTPRSARRIVARDT